jgi:hypothetical protein
MTVVRKGPRLPLGKIVVVVVQIFRVFMDIPLPNRRLYLAVHR